MSSRGVKSCTDVAIVNTHHGSTGSRTAPTFVQTVRLKHKEVKWLSHQHLARYGCATLGAGSSFLPHKDPSLPHHPLLPAQSRPLVTVRGLSSWWVLSWVEGDAWEWGAPLQACVQREAEASSLGWRLD